MASKHIFIGLGGSGLRTVAQIKYKIYERIVERDGKSRAAIINESHRFLFVDTDKGEIAKLNETYKDLYGPGDLLSEISELTYLGDKCPRDIYDLLDTKNQIDKRIVEACSSKSYGILEKQVLCVGAGADRMNSRIVFARKAADFRTKLKNHLDSLFVKSSETANQANDVTYWVVSSSCGGTGSGIINDILFEINMLNKSSRDQVPNVVLTLFMPQPYINTNLSNEKYPLNGMAVLREISEFKKRSSEVEKNMLFKRMALVEDINQIDKKWGYDPFTFCIPIDVQMSDKLVVEDFDIMYCNTAELLYFLQDSLGGGKFFSGIINSKSNKLNDDKFLVPFGFTALRKPEKEFEDYLTIRFKYELLKYGIIGKTPNTSTLKEEMQTSFDTKIYNSLFNTANTESFIVHLNKKKEVLFENDLSNSIIENDNGKIVKVLPEFISEGFANDIITNFRTQISAPDFRKQIIETIENNIWEWVEEKTIANGLEFSKLAISHLDDYCTDFYKDFIEGTKNKKGFSNKKELENRITESKDKFLCSFVKANEVTFTESITGGNAKDVENCFNYLKEWIEENISLIIYEELYSVIKELSYGDKAKLDSIKEHVTKLYSAACTAREVAIISYNKLAKTFYQTKSNTTTVFLPNISSFVDATHWNTDNNLFSDLYSQIIAPSTEIVVGKGYEPMRNGVNSIEQFLNHIKTSFCESLAKHHYIKSGKSKLFTNTSLTNYNKMIEDILFYANEQLSKSRKENMYISTYWNNKSLAQLAEESLDGKLKEELTKLLQPELFFPNNLALAQLDPKYCCVSPNKETSTKLFSFATGEQVDNTSNSIMYILKYVEGLRFADYSSYPLMKQKYDNCTIKENYHFHQVFAKYCNDLDKMEMPPEIPIHLKTFVKLLLLNQYSTTIKALYYTSRASTNRGKYATTPFFIGKGSVKIAKSDSFSLINENIALEISKFDTITFETGKQYWDVYTEFSEQIITSKYNEFVSQIQKEIYKKDTHILPDNFNIVKAKLIKEINAAHWKAKNNNDSEKIILQDIAEIVGTMTYKEFIA